MYRAPRTRLSIVLLCIATFACTDEQQPPDDPPSWPVLDPVVDPLDWVDPTIGTGGFGFAYGSAFVGAAAPHGLVKLGPDTRGAFGTIGFLHYSGYHADDDVIERFSHMHLHGAGLSDYGVVGVMPTIAFDPQQTSAHDYRSMFDKTNEIATPGRYQVTLQPSQIAVDLTATTRAAHHRYTFPRGERGTLVIDLQSALDGGEVTIAELQLDPITRSLTGSLHHKGQMSGGYGGHNVYIAARTQGSWEESYTWEHGAALTFAADEVVELQIGLSLVSPAGALANLEAELPAWSFDDTATATKAAWRERLATILVEGGTIETRRMLYSALYRSWLMPTITSDVDGSYLYGERLGTMSVGAFMSDLSLWDTYRTLHPLYHLLAPESGADSVRSLVAMSEVGRGFPRWPIAIGESGTMLGASADVVLADAAIKLDATIDIEGFDAQSVFDQLVYIATDDTLSPDERGGRAPADDYIALGYVPSTIGRSVSTHLEYAVDDHAIARMAVALGRDSVASMFEERARSYRQLYDPTTQTFRPRAPDGSFPSAEGYDPLAFGDEFAEANALQMLWAPLHDVDGLVELLGGDDIFVDRLQAFFSEAADDLDTFGLDDLLANASPRSYYWHGNEPDIHAAYLFGQVGRDDLTQIWLTWIREQLYADSPAGLAGNDDSGTLSSWYVWSALGIYPVAGSERYFVGMPLFPKITVTTTTGTLTIEAPALDASIRGVASVTVDGRALEHAEIAHHELLGDVTISFDMVEQPTAWSRR